MSDFDALLTSDAAWAAAIERQLTALTDSGAGQQALWPVDDVLGPQRYLPCPRRGWHVQLVDCWMCWCDVVCGRATASDVMRPDPHDNR